MREENQKVAWYDTLPSFGVQDLADIVSNLANSQWVHVQAKAYRTEGMPSRVNGNILCQERPGVTKSVKDPLVWRAKLGGLQRCPDPHQHAFPWGSPRILLRTLRVTDVACKYSL